MGTNGRTESSSAVGRCSCCTARSFSASFSCSVTRHRHTSHTAFSQPLRCGTSHTVRRSARWLFMTRAGISQSDAPLDVSGSSEAVQAHRGCYTSPIFQHANLSEPKQHRHHSTFDFGETFGDWKNKLLVFPSPARSCSLVVTHRQPSSHLAPPPKLWTTALTARSPSECLRWPFGAWLLWRRRRCTSQCTQCTKFLRRLGNNVNRIT